MSSAATTESWEQREERWIDWTSRPYQFVPLNLYDETQKLSEIAVGEMLAEIERLRKAARMKSAAYTERDLAMQTLDGTLPCEETWRENATNVLHLLNDLERLRGERFDTSNVTIRDLGRIAVEGLTVMRDEDDDEWVLPDLQTINRAIAAVTALVSHAEDRQRFKRALRRIADENASSDAVREYARSVLAGGSARVPFGKGADVAV